MGAFENSNLYLSILLEIWDFLKQCSKTHSLIKDLGRVFVKIHTILSGTSVNEKRQLNFPKKGSVKKKKKKKLKQDLTFPKDWSLFIRKGMFFITSFLVHIKISSCESLDVCNWLFQFWHPNDILICLSTPPQMRHHCTCYSKVSHVAVVLTG